MGDLTEHMSRHEYACPCCGLDNISLPFVDKLQVARKIYGRPIAIESGCRCVAHNIAVGGVMGSTHIAIPNGGEARDGHAADLVCTNTWDRAELLAALFQVFRKPYIRIGIGGTFIHVDDDLVAPHPRVWLYLPHERHVA